MTFAEIIPGLLNGKRYGPTNSMYAVGFDNKTGELTIYYGGGEQDRYPIFTFDLERTDWEEVK